MPFAFDIPSQVAVPASTVGKEDADLSRNERIFRDIQLLSFFGRFPDWK